MMKTDLFLKLFRRFVVVLLMVLPLNLFAREVYGDVNGDLEVNIADINSVINIILNGSDATGAADVNNDGEINIADVNAVIDVILNGGIDPHFLDVCGIVAEIDKVVKGYYMQCETLDEMKPYRDEIMALDGVLDVFFDDNTSMFVAIRDFGTVSYSFYPVDNEEASVWNQPLLFKRNNTEQNDAYSHQILTDAEVLIVNQMTKDEDRRRFALSVDLLWQCFVDAGFNVLPIVDAPDIEFYRNGLFGHDYVCLMTHGQYEKPIDGQGKHWLLTSVEVPNSSFGLFVDKNKLAELCNGYDEQDVSYGTVKEKRSGKTSCITYLKVSEHFISTSNKKFKHPGKGIIYNAACQSMKGPGTNAPDTINYSLSRIFEDKGAGTYLGYDETVGCGDLGGLEFWSRLLSGMSIGGAHEQIDFKVKHNYIKHKWADLKLHSPGMKNTCIIKPMIECQDFSDNYGLRIKLKAANYTVFFSEDKDSESMILNDVELLRNSVLRYGFILSESNQFVDPVILCDKRVGDENCNLSENNQYVIFEQLLTNDVSQAGSQIRPNTTYWVRAYVHDGQGYNYSDPISFTTGALTDDQPTVESFIANGVPFTMVNVEGGSFTMGATVEQGADANDAEKPAHKVTLSSFSIGQTEVTQALWLAVMGSNPSGFTGDLNLPVEQVSWYDCQTFISKLNELNISDHQFRLPTDAEWEYAARGGNQSMSFKYSGCNSIDEVAWYNSNSTSTHTVATKTANELGIFDMSGNVWEWCQDWYGDFNADDQINPTGPANGSGRCMRSGSWDFNSWFCRVSHRNYDSPERKSNHLGFRIAYGDMTVLPIALSEEELMLEVNEQQTISILNGSGHYSVSGGDGIVSVTVNDDKLILTGLVSGSSTITIKDNSSKTRVSLDICVYNVETFNVHGVLFKMIEVEGGTFTMGATAEQGSDPQWWEYPVHQVTLSSYYLGQTEVTQALWSAVMGSNPSHFRGQNLPVEMVTWHDCQQFITKLNEITGKSFRLPTEAEWEFAARGGNRSKSFKYAGSNSIGDVAWYSGNASSTTHIVATKVSNELMLYDMSGNVAEWVQDWYGDYSSVAQTNPQGPLSGSKRTQRNGSYADYATTSRVSCRYGMYPEHYSSALGLRLAL